MHVQTEFIPGMQDSLNFWKSKNAIYHMNKLEKERPYHQHSRCRKSIWQNPTFIPNKNTQQTLNRKELTQDKRHLWKS